jgi:hypothetical protein
MGTEEKQGGTGESLTAAGIKAASNIALEVYKDAAQPATQELGEALGKLAKIVVYPITMIAAGTEWIRSLLARTQAKLEEASTAQYTSPPTTIAGHVMLNYSLLGDDERAESELRDMYASLLASAIDRDTAPAAHPAFVTMIAQMSSVEATLIKIMASDPWDIWPVVELRDVSESNRSYISYGRIFGIDEFNRRGTDYEQYFDNLERLRIVSVEFKKAVWPDISETDPYQKLEAIMAGQIKDIELVGSLQYRRGILRLTSFGRQFAKICVRKEVVRGSREHAYAQRAKRRTESLAMSVPDTVVGAGRAPISSPFGASQKDDTEMK